MDMRKDILLFESELLESAEQDLHYLQTPQGELLGHSFADANDPVELQHAVIGMAGELHDAMRRGDIQTAMDYGLSNSGEMQQFLDFCSKVANNPQDYFSAYHGTQVTEAVADDEFDADNKISDLENKMSHLKGKAKEKAESDLISLRHQKDQFNGQ